MRLSIEARVFLSQLPNPAARPLRSLASASKSLAWVASFRDLTATGWPSPPSRRCSMVSMTAL